MILGIYHPAEGFGHDTAVALLEDGGTIIAAQAEERFSRIKMDGGFPFRAVESLQSIRKFGASDLACVAVPFLAPRDKLREGMRLLGASAADPALIAGQARVRLGHDRFQAGMTQLGAYRYIAEYRARAAEVRQRDQRADPKGWRDFLRTIGLGGVPTMEVDHHLAHAASAYFTSGWDETLVVTCDGLGALKSSIVAVGRAGKLSIVARTFYPHSPGEFWEAITAICGFHHMRHGGKITGLAAYGDPDAACYQVMREALGARGLRFRAAIDPVRLSRELEGAKREDIAAAAQRRLEEVVTEVVGSAARRTRQRRVALAGGVFANVKLNQRIAELPEIDEIHVCPAMGDEGLGLGAALYAANRLSGARPSSLDHVYLGPEYSDTEMERVLQQGGLSARRYPDPVLAQRVAEQLAGGRVVGLFRGRMEFGPRALGHRTILCRATDPDVNRWLNEKLRRTEFMPFAPATLAAQADRCYRDLPGRRYAAEFMTVTCDCTPWMREVSPAVVHRDGTARPQLVRPDVEPFYHEILTRYASLTGVPSIINTSFNMHEEPIVCSPGDAVRAFQEGKLDSLVMGPYLVCADGC